MRFNIRLELDERTGTWRAFVPAIEDLSAFGETKESALQRIRRAIEGYLESALEVGFPIPKGDDRTEWTQLTVAVP
jgi:predicted RNase H-like HicB family nuclease